jgi:cell division septation protein DedD
VKRAYRTKALLVHPDRNPNGGEAFKALQDAYEAALADVKRGGPRSYHSRGGPYHTSPSSSSSAPSAGAAAAAGTAYHYARASASTRSGSPPLFSEEELFGDAVPGGWRDVGSQQRQTQSEGRPSARATSFSSTASYTHGSGAGTTTSSSPTDERWRRAHGSRVPVSAYEGSCPVPPPPRTEGTAARSSFSSVPPAHTSATPPAASSSSSSSPSSAASKFTEKPTTSTQAQWEAFLAREHPWKPSLPAHCAGQSSSAHFSAEEGEGTSESAEDRAYREAMFLHRHVQELGRREHPPSLSPESTAELLKKAELNRQWQDVQASLHRKLDRQEPVSPSAAPQGSEGVDEGNNSSPEAAAAAALGPSPSVRPAFEVPLPRGQDNAHREAILKERRLLQREYLRYRYTPDPADVGAMSDMEVYLLAELLRDIQTKVQAVLTARLARGPCSACGAQPRDKSEPHFTCGHQSVCAACYASGVLSCPLCGVPRIEAPATPGAAAVAADEA